MTRASLHLAGSQSVFRGLAKCLEPRCVEENVGELPAADVAAKK